jgi:hypothetical protein
MPLTKWGQSAQQLAIKFGSCKYVHYPLAELESVLHPVVDRMLKGRAAFFSQWSWYFRRGSRQQTG